MLQSQVLPLLAHTPYIHSKVGVGSFLFDVRIPYTYKILFFFLKWLPNTVYLLCGGWIKNDPFLPFSFIWFIIHGDHVVFFSNLYLFYRKIYNLLPLSCYHSENTIDYILKCVWAVRTRICIVGYDSLDGGVGECCFSYFCIPLLYMIIQRISRGLLLIV